MGASETRISDVGVGTLRLPRPTDAENVDKNNGKEEDEIGIWEKLRAICALFLKTCQTNVPW
jgi:hypothetical protein